MYHEILYTIVWRFRGILRVYNYAYKLILAFKGFLHEGRTTLNQSAFTVESTPLNNYKVEAGPLNLVSAMFLFYEKLAPILI